MVWGIYRINSIDMSIKDTIKNLPVPYWVKHAIVAGMIAAIVMLLTLALPAKLFLAGAASGICYYAGREVAQHEAKGYFDYLGLIGPTLFFAFLYIILLLIF